MFLQIKSAIFSLQLYFITVLVFVVIYNQHMKTKHLTLLSCMSRLAPFFKSTSVASTLLTAAAQCRADLPKMMGR